jgi:hypothetical protein
VVSIFTAVIVMQCCFGQDIARFTLLDDHAILWKLFMLSLIKYKRNTFSIYVIEDTENEINLLN